MNLESLEQFEREVKEMKDRVADDFKKRIAEIRPDLREEDIEMMNAVRTLADTLGETIGPKATFGLLTMLSNHLVENAGLYEVRRTLLQFLRDDLPEAEKNGFNIPKSV